MCSLGRAGRWREPWTLSSPLQAPGSHSRGLTPGVSSIVLLFNFFVLSPLKSLSTAQSSACRERNLKSDGLHPFLPSCQGYLHGHFHVACGTSQWAEGYQVWSHSFLVLWTWAGRWQQDQRRPHEAGIPVSARFLLLPRPWLEFGSYNEKVSTGDAAQLELPRCYLNEIGRYIATDHWGIFRAVTGAVLTSAKNKSKITIGR